jgi:septation ring formation regulator EzrA
MVETKRSEVKRRKKKLTEIEWKLRNMRATAVKIRDEELTAEEEKELQEYFNHLKTEVKKCEVLG